MDTQDENTDVIFKKKKSICGCIIILIVVDLLSTGAGL